MFAFSMLDILKMGITSLLTLIVTLYFKRRDNRQIILTKSVRIHRLGFSAEHQIWGNLTLKYNDIPVNNMHFITIDLKNDTNRDCEEFVFELGLPGGFFIYAHEGRLSSNDIYKQVLLEPKFNEKFSQTKQDYDEHSKGNKEVFPLPETLGKDIDFISRNRKFNVEALNRKSQVTFELFIENKGSLTITSNEIFADVFKKGIKVVYATSEEKRKKLREAWINYGGLLIFLSLSIPIHIYSQSIAIAIVAMIVSLIFSGILGLAMFHFYAWIRRQFA